MIGLMPRTKRGLVVFFSALLMLSLALQYASAMTPRSALASQVECFSFAIQTTDPNGEQNNGNIYASKPDVYLNGGPGPSGQLPEGTIVYYRVEEPNGTPLSEIRQVAADADGKFFVQLFPFDTTTNPGGEYSVTASQLPNLAKGSCTKNDNFKVDGPGNLKIVKAVDGGEAEGDFDFHVDCGLSGKFDVTVSFPDPGFKTITGIDALAECTVTETDMPNPPANFEWGNVTINGSPATIASDATVTVTATNHLIRQTGSLKITKVIPGVPEGYSGSFGVHVTCDEGGPFDATIAFPDPGFVTINNIPAGATCAVIETTKSAPPAGFLFAGSNVNGPVTIAANQTAELTVTNLLSELTGTPVLTIDKSNDAPLVNNLPTADVGDTVTYTLAYTLADGPAANGVIKDVLPTGVTYVTGSATNSGNGEFVFQGYDSGTRTLTWTAASVTASGSVTYKATVDEGAAALAQPLVNTATIDSDDTEPDSDTSQVFVAPPPLAETAPPTTTAPPTDVAGTGSGSSSSGGSMLLVLLALAGIALLSLILLPGDRKSRQR
jgi:fimbrial isopeptide formation D2 family protein